MHLALSARRFLHMGLATPVVALVAMVGCTMVGDSLTGVSARVNPSACIRECVETQTDAVQAEASFHQAQIEACQALPDHAKGQCIAAEAARHAAAMEQISSGRRECLNGCHRQGSGSAG